MLKAPRRYPQGAAAVSSNGANRVAGHPTASLSPVPEGADLPQAAVARIPGDVREMPGVRFEIRAGAGILPGRDVLQLSALDSAGPGDRAADLAADALAV